MTNLNPTTPSDIARTLKRAGWKPDKNETWRSGTGNVCNWSVAIYLHSLGESTAPFIVVPDNRELRKDKKPGLGNPATKPPAPAKVKKLPHNALSAEKMKEIHKIGKEGLSLTVAAKKLGIARSTLSKHLKRSNEPA